MYVIKLPPPVVLDPKEPTRTMSLGDLVLLMLAADRRPNADTKGALAGERIARAVQALTPASSELKLETTDGELVREIFASPSDGYPVRPVWMVASLLRAVAEMKEER